MCGSRGALEFDRIARLSCSYGEQEFQPLCVECHREKTANEARMYDGDQLQATLNLKFGSSTLSLLAHPLWWLGFEKRPPHKAWR